MAKSYEELVFSDDFMFEKVMEDKKLCKQLLECLLGRPVGELEDVQPERQLRYTVDGKPIRLDIYTKDENSIYDAEMQNLNHQRVESLDLPKRSRFYQSMIDSDFLQKNGSYRHLPEGNILFLCTFDPFGLDLPKYTFMNVCKENTNLCLKDGTFKIFYNCASKAEEIPKDVEALYQYIQTGIESSELTKQIHQAVKKARRNEIWRSEYMKELLHDQDVREEGREEVIQTWIENWSKKGKTVSEIAELLECSEEDVKARM